MITYPRSTEPGKSPVLRLIGVGNAGVNIADRIAARSPIALETVAANSDRQSVSSSVAASKVAIGPMATHGLGAGGDPDMALEAARESMQELKNCVAGADVVFLCAGLGGGTGSATVPVLAKLARESGAFVAAVVTSPFEFEGRRRAAQARQALVETGNSVDALVHFENDRMSELGAAKADAAEAFAACDQVIFQAVCALARLAIERGPVPVPLADLLAVLRGPGHCLFACGESSGPNRAQEALESALGSPLMDRGRSLRECGRLLVHVSGPPSMGFAEVTNVMNGISAHASPDAILNLGVGTSGSDSGSLVVTVIGRTGRHEKPAAAEQPAAFEAPRRAVQPEPAKAPEPAPLLDSPVQPTAAQPQKVKQDFLPLEPMSRGRFDKIEPTIVEGEDLDVPTFLRMKLKR
jgi:cell division protein FtsZ